MTASEKVAELTKASREVYESVRDAYRNIKKESGWLNEVRAAIRIVPAAVGQVETIAKKLDLNGVDKKALAVEAIMANVKLPWWLPSRIVRYLVGEAIDAAVEAINKQLKRK